jgi:hypothetical protein
MLEKAMKLKEKKNMGPLKGNSFSSLHPNSINQSANDVRIKLGNDASEIEYFINQVIEEEQSKQDKVVGDNPKMNLPTNMDVEIDRTLVDNSGGMQIKINPDDSLEDSAI